MADKIVEKIVFAGLSFFIIAFAFCKTCLAAQPKQTAQSAWLMRSHDERRTGRTTAYGARRGDRVWSFVANDGYAINMEPSATDDGVFFGTWGLIRKAGLSKAQWDKCDGKLYGLSPSTGKPLWPPVHPGLTPYGYKYDGRPIADQDRQAGAGLHLNYFNGTVEGTPAIDPLRHILFVGRGDGCLYSLDYLRGKVEWKYLTQDPARGADPESGGEVIGGPLRTRDGQLIFATFAAPVAPRPPKTICHESNAVYCLDANGHLLWRYPQTGGFPNVFNAPLALSPDGERVYAVTGLVNVNRTCDMLALDRRTGRLIWSMPLKDCGGHDLAVGIDGTIFVAGMVRRGLRIEAAAFAVKDEGTRGRMLWGPAISDSPLAQFAGGVALVEEGARVVDVMVSTANLRGLIVSGVPGRLYKLDPLTGRIKASWSPDTAQPPCEGGLTDVSIDGEGVIYVGARGANAPAGFKGKRGRMYCLKFNGREFSVLWSHEAEGNIDWASPAIGPDGGVFFGSTARLNPLVSVLPHAPDEDVKNADPIFYGVYDSVDPSRQ